MMKIERITTPEEFYRLEPVWNTLLSRSASNTIGLTWEWLTTWWDVFGRGRQLCILLVRDGDDVIGIAPLMIRTVPYYGVLPFRRLEFLASGENEEDEICTEYLDFILLRGREEEALNAIFEHLRQDQREWDEIVLASVSGSSPNLPILEKLAPRYGIAITATQEGMAIFRELPQTWDEFLTSLSRDFRKKLLRDLRTFGIEGGELLEVDSEELFRGHFPILKGLHQSRWTAQGHRGVFASRKFCAFHETVASRMLPKGWVKLFVMTVGGAPVAALYDFVYAGKIYYYQSGFNGGVSKMASPGILTRTLAIRSAIERGLTECDFLRGRAGSYKFRWGGKTRSIMRVRLARSNSKEKVLNAASTLVAGLRQVKRAVLKAAAM